MHLTDTRLHVIIQDAAQQVYQVPETVLPRPGGAFEAPDDHALEFNYVDEPFSFSVKRAGTDEILFDSSAVCSDIAYAEYLSPMFAGLSHLRKPVSALADESARCTQLIRPWRAHRPIHAEHDKLHTHSLEQGCVRIRRTTAYLKIVRD